MKTNRISENLTGVLPIKKPVSTTGPGRSPESHAEGSLSLKCIEAEIERGSEHFESAYQLAKESAVQVEREMYEMATRSEPRLRLRLVEP